MERRIDWDTAEVRDGRLTVELVGDGPKGWTKRIPGVIAMLSPRGEGWGEITANKHRLEVGAVKEGSEDDLRHLLESALQQVDADLSGDSQDSEDSDSGKDRKMAETFRRFAESAPD